MARKVLKGLLWSLVAAAGLLLSAIAAFVLTFDANDYRRFVEEAVSEALGRAVRISGDLEITPALVPTLAVNEVTIANPAWASEPTMASAGRLEVTVALLPLLDGVIQVRDVVLERVDASLQRGLDGRGNWEFDFLFDPSAAEPAQSRYRTRVSQIELREITVRYLTADATTLLSGIDRVTLKHLPSEAIEIEGSGRLGDVPIAVSWQAGPLGDAAADQELRWPIRARAELGDTTLTLTGRLRAPLAYSHATFQFAIASRDASGLRRRLNRAGDGPLAYSLSGNVRIDAASVVVANLAGELSSAGPLEGLTVESGGVVLARGQRIEAELRGRRSGQAFAVSSRLGTPTEVLADTPWPLDVDLSLDEARAQVSGEVAAASGATRMTADVAVRGPIFEAVNKLTGWKLPELGPVAFDSRVVLEPARASFAAFTLSAAGNTLLGDLEVTRTATRPFVAATLRSPGIDLARLGSTASPRAAEPLLDRALPVDWLDHADATVDLELDALEGLPVPIGSLEGRASLTAGALELRLDSAEIAGVAVGGIAKIGRSARGARIDLDLRARSIDLERVRAALGDSSTSAVRASAESASLALQASGATLRAAAENCTAALRAGPVELEVPAGRAPAVATLSALEIEVAPGRELKLEVEGRFTSELAGERLAAAFEASATGGTLKQLVATPRLWPSIDFTATSEHRNTPVKLAGRIGDAAKWLNREPTDVRLDAAWGPLEASMSARLVPGGGLVGSTAELALATGDLAAAAELLGADGLPTGPASLSANARLGERDWVLTISTIAAPGIEGAGEFGSSHADAAGLRGRLQLESLDLTPYVLRGERRQDGEPLALHTLYSSERFPVSPLRRAQLEIEVTAEELRFGTFVSRDTRLAVALEAATLEVDATLDGGRIRTNARLDARSDHPEFTLQLAGDGIALAADRSGAPASGTPVVDMNATLSGSGQSSQELVRSLDGDLLVYLRGGRIPATGLRFCSVRSCSSCWAPSIRSTNGKPRSSSSARAPTSKSPTASCRPRTGLSCRRRRCKS